MLYMSLYQKMEGFWKWEVETNIVKQLPCARKRAKAQRLLYLILMRAYDTDIPLLQKKLRSAEFKLPPVWRWWVEFKPKTTWHEHLCLVHFYLFPLTPFLLLFCDIPTKWFSILLVNKTFCYQKWYKPEFLTPMRICSETGTFILFLL